MSKNLNLSILASFLGLWTTSFLTDKLQIIVGFLLIFSFGILHGANDLVILTKLNASKKTNSFLKLIFSYSIVIFFSVLLFLLIPWLALLLFIIVSGYHFGEQHWQHLNFFKQKVLKCIFQFTYGIFILLLLFVFHSKEVEQIIFSIIKIDIHFINILILLEIFGFILSLFFVSYSYKLIEFRNKIAEEILYLIVFAILFKVGSLIWGFALYFIFWHSIPSLQDQIRFLYGNYSFKNFKLYFKSAFVYWLVSLFGIVVLYIVFKNQTIFDALFFSFLAAITFPHTFVIIKMFKNKHKKKPNN